MPRCDLPTKLFTAITAALVFLLLALLPASVEAKVAPVTHVERVSHRVHLAAAHGRAVKRVARRPWVTIAKHRTGRHGTSATASSSTQALSVQRSASLPSGAAGSSQAGGSVVQFNREDFAYSSSLSTQAEAGRYQVMVMQATDASEIPALKAANPNLKILIYQDPMLARPSDPSGETVCSDWQDLAGADSGWMLRDQNDNTIPDAQESGNYLMDVGNAAYQQSCVAHAIALAKQDGADGVFFDDVNAAVSWYLPAGVSDSEYPDAGAWQNAETSFLAYATAQLHANGLLSVANIGGASSTPGLWAKWSSLVDGSMEQAWNDWSAGSSSVTADWQGLLQEELWSEAHGKYMLEQSSDDGESQNTFGVASMLLGANGMSSYATSNLNFTTDEEWYPTYTAAQKLGAPQGNYSELANGLYERTFANGIVIVNPTGTSQSVALPATMTNSATGQALSTLTATPTTGYILQTR